MPVALFAAAVSPPHLYALAVMKLYMTKPMRADEPPPLDEIMQKLSGWDKLPKAVVMQVRSRSSPFITQINAKVAMDRHHCPFSSV